jgi:anti-sigma B factor antagonist
MSEPKVILDQTIRDLAVKAYKKDPAGNVIIVLEGAIESYNSNDFEEILKMLVAAGHLNLVFACSKLNYVSSIGIGVFMNLLTTIKKKNGSIVFAEVQEPVARVFDNLGFSVFFTFQDKLE